MRHLIIGANGLVGGHFLSFLQSTDIDVEGTYFSRQRNKLNFLNLLDLESIYSFLEKFKPDVIIICSNFPGGVDKCESEKEKSKKLHYDSTVEIVKFCKDFSSKLVYISTDYVFDGLNSPYSEEDSPNPLNYYGEMKLKSEKIIAQELEKYLIIRTTNVFGWDPKTVTPNFMMSAYFKLINEESVPSPSFLFGNPTYVTDLVSGICSLLEKKKNGLYHLVGDSYLNRFEWLNIFCDIAEFDNSLLEKIETPPDFKVKRPLNSNLLNHKFCEATNFKMNDVFSATKLFVNEMKNHKD